MKKVSFTIVLLIMGLTNIIAQNAPKSGPCPGMPQFTDPRDGKTYNTVQIGDRCWMKENLNVGTFINSLVDQTDNAIIEKYCYDNTESNCNAYGGLYIWNEMMQYSDVAGIKGICPEGWKIPTDDEWCALTSYLDVTVDCNFIGFSGTNAGGSLKETGIAHWFAPNAGATNESGFTGLPGGSFANSNQSFINKGCYGFFHTSSSNGTNKTGKWAWLLNSDEATVSRISFMPGGGYSVRCIRDANYSVQLSVTPENQDVTAEAGTASFEVYSNIAWLVTESADWLSVLPASGSNNGTIIVTYDANNLTTPRVGQISVTDETGTLVTNITVTQAGLVPQLTVTPLNQDVTATAGTTTFEVTSNTSWAVEESVSWLSVSPASGSNNGTITVTYEANTSPDPRSGQITITAGGGSPEVNVTVNQAGWVCGMPLTDTRDSKIYTTVQIGSQCWMAQNLNIGTRIAGASNQTNNAVVEKYCYGNLETNCDVYGGLYQWDEMMQYSTTPAVQGICSTGWHLPTDAEWTTLTTFLGGESIAGGKMKETGTTHWTPPNTGATNSSGFTALPAGYRNSDGNFGNLGDYAILWSSSELNVSNAVYRNLDYGNSDVVREFYFKVGGFSVRCLKD